MSQDDGVRLDKVTDRNVDVERWAAALLRLSNLNLDEREVVYEVTVRAIEGLEIGRELYGPLDLSSDERDFRSEAADELRDGAIYLAADRVKRGRE
jgi:hypothetical protein